jgi:hypothetical protein
MKLIDIQIQISIDIFVLFFNYKKLPFKNLVCDQNIQKFMKKNPIKNKNEFQPVSHNAGRARIVTILANIQPHLKRVYVGNRGTELILW